MLTNLDVIDSAVKIGLGAFIGIIGSLMAGRQRHSQELRKESLRRRQDALERLVEDFEFVQMACTDLHGDYAVYVRFFGKNEAVATIQREKVDKILTTGFSSVVQRLHGIEGRLRLFELNACSEAVREYRSRVANLLKAVALAEPFPSESTLNELLKAIGDTRVEVYTLLAAAYRGKRTIPSVLSSWAIRAKPWIG
jgi:hypothetical protein